LSDIAYKSVLVTSQSVVEICHHLLRVSPGGSKPAFTRLI